MRIKQKFGKAPTFIRADNGKELINDKIIKLCRTEGITIEAMAKMALLNALIELLLN